MISFAKVTRANFLPASVIPFLTGAVFALVSGYHIGPLRLVLGITGVIFVHLAGNVFNDYFDHGTGADAMNTMPSPFFGGSRVIQEGGLSARSVLFAGIALFFAAFLCGLAVFFLTGNPVFFLLMAGAFALTVEYTARPLRLCYRMLGELDIFVLFGVLLVMGGFYLFAERFTLNSFLVSLPVAFLIFAVIVCNEVPDYPSDVKAGKRTLIYLAGRDSGYLVYLLAVSLSMLSVVVNIYAGNISVWAMALLPVYYLGWKAARFLKADDGDLEKKIKASFLTVLMHALAGGGVILSIIIKR